MKSLIRKITNPKFIFRIQVFYILMYLLFSGRINVYISFTVAISLNIASLILIVCNMKKDFGIKTILFVLSIFQTLFTIFLYLLPEAGIPPAIQLF